MKNIFMIINYNDYENTNKLIENIKKYKIIDNILIVDNCSKDNIYQRLKKIDSKKIITIKTEKNKGYGYAINYGAKYLKKKFVDCNIIISNSDIEIYEEKDLEEIYSLLNDEEIAVVAPSIEQNGEICLGWKMPNILDALIMNVPKLNRWYEKKCLNYNIKYFQHKTKEVEVFSGCFFAIKLSVLEEIGYFDENIFLYYEENILSKKIKDINKKIIVNPNIIIKHNHSLSINKNLNEYKKLVELKKSQYYFYKNIMKTNVIGLFFLKTTNKLILNTKKAKVGSKI